MNSGIDSIRTHRTTCTSQSTVERRKQMRHICPWSYLCPPWGSAQSMLRWCTLGTLTYVFVGLVVPPVVWISGFIWDEQSGEYEVVVKCSKLAFMISSMLAINSLFEMAHVFLEELHELSPLSKFLSVKMVIFFTFWQGLVLAWLEQGGFFQSFLDVEHHWVSGEQISQAVQHCLICFEMFIASIFHHWAFPASDYRVVKRMAHKRSRSGLYTAEDAHHFQAVMRRGFQVVNLTDIFKIAWRGFTPNRFEDKVDGESVSSDTASEADSENKDDDHTSPTSQH